METGKRGKEENPTLFNKNQLSMLEKKKPGVVLQDRLDLPSICKIGTKFKFSTIYVVQSINVNSVL